MAYAFIGARKLKFTVKGVDYDYVPYSRPNLGFPTWSSFILTNAETSNNKTESTSDPSSTTASQVLACQTPSLPNLRSIWDSLSTNEEIYFWREEVGRNIRFVLRKNTNYRFIPYAYTYGTYTAGNTITMISGPYTTLMVPCGYVGFLYNESNGRYTYYTTTAGSNNDHHMGAIVATYPFSAQISSVLTILFTGNTPLPPSSDPYGPGGNSETTPSTMGDFDAESDAIEADAITTLSPVDAGFIVLYAVDRTNIRTFVNYLFTGADLTNIKKLWASPREAIVCLNYFPFTPDGAATTPSDITFAAGDSGADGYLITQQYEELDFGSVTLNEYYGSCLDYSPQTTVQLILPFVAGSVDLDPDEFMGKTIGVKCRVDVYTGAGLYLIDDGTSVLLQVPCTLANPLPWSSSDYSSLVSSIAGVVATGAGALIAIGTGGTGTPAALAIAGAATANIASNVMGAKLHYQHGGAGGTGTGMFGIQKPYLIIKRPRQCLPVDNNKFQGYPTMVTLRMGTLSGFTKVHQIHLDIPQATDAERRELETILKGGVWI